MAATQIVEARAVVLESSDSPTGFMLRVITPGMGSSGYYEQSVLEAAVADNVFGKGTHIYIDHPSQSESKDRPERSVKDLAGSFAGDAVWNSIENAIDAPCKVYPHYAWIKDVAEDIGMSIRASADVSEAVIEGQRVPKVDKLIEAFSVDFVTKAGRGGKVLAAIESARKGMDATVTNDTGKPEAVLSQADTEAMAARVAELPLVIAGGQSSTSEETLVPAVQESAEVAEATRRIEAAEARATAAEAERDQLRAQIAERDNREDAVRRVTERLSVRFDQWPTVKTRVVESVTATLPIKDGALDVAALESATDRAAESELSYLRAILAGGTVSGHGQTTAVTTPDDHVASEAARTRIPFTRPTVRN